MALGLCVNHRTCWPSTSDIAALGLAGGWVRSIVYDFDAFDTALRALPADVKVCALLRKECAQVGSNYENWDAAVLQFSRRFEGRVLACEADNEADLNGDSPAHSVDLLRRAKPALLAAHMRPILTSVAGPNWQDYLVACRLLLGPDAAGCSGALHPYGSRAGNYPSDTWGFGEISAQVRRAHDLLGLPIAVTECGVKIRDIGGETQQATWITRAHDALRTLGADVMPFATLFCLGDEMGSPGEQGLNGFGLRRIGGAHRPAWAAFSAVNGGPSVPKPPPDLHPIFQLGFAEWAAKDPALLGQPLENERGGVPGFSVQKTTKGRLMAQYLAVPESNAIRGWTLTFWADADGSRWLYKQDHSEQIA